MQERAAFVGAGCLNGVAICSDTLGGLKRAEDPSRRVLGTGSVHVCLMETAGARSHLPVGSGWTGRFHGTSVSPGLPQTWNPQTASTSRNHSKIVLNENHGRETPPLD